MRIVATLKDFWNDSLESRLVLVVMASVIVVAAAFGGFYYWDRYVHLGDQSPLEMGVEHLEEMVRENPQDPDARVALAQYYFENSAYSQAIEQAQQVLNTFPDNDGALFVLGMSYVQSEQIETAIEPLEQFAAIRREAPMANTDNVLEAALYFLGESYVKLQQPDNAVAALTEALVINRTDADAMYQLGLAYSQEEQHDLAIEQYHNAVRFVPDFTEAFQGMIESYAALEKPDYVAYARGMEAFSMKDYGVARTHLENAVVNLPDYAPAYFGLGLTYEQLGDLQAAQTELERVLELDPANFAASQALGRVQLMLDDQKS